MLLQGGEKIAIPGFTRNPLLDPLHRISLSGLALVLYLLHTAGENGRSAVRVYHAQRVIRADEAAGATTAMTATMVSAGEISRLERAAAKPAAGAWGSRPGRCGVLFVVLAVHAIAPNLTKIRAYRCLSAQLGGAFVYISGQNFLWNDGGRVARNMGIIGVSP